MRAFSLVTLLLLFSSSAVVQIVWAQDDNSAIDVDAIGTDDGADDNTDGELDETDTTPRTLGQRCGNGIPCEEGLDCVRAPIRKKCFPITCGVNAVRTAFAQTKFDLKNYGQQMMAKAGVTMESSMFRSYPDAGYNLIQRDHTDTYRLLNTIRDNQPPFALITQSFNNCTKAAQAMGVTPYGGLSWELGLLGTYNGDLFWGQGTGDAVGVGLINNCFGAVLGYDAGLSGLLGLGFTQSIANMANGCKQVFPIAEFPPFGLQLGFIAADVPIFLMEFAGGASASAGLPGYTTCTTDAL